MSAHLPFLPYNKQLITPLNFTPLLKNPHAHHLSTASRVVPHEPQTQSLLQYPRANFIAVGAQSRKRELIWQAGSPSHAVCSQSKAFIPAPTAPAALTPVGQGKTSKIPHPHPKPTRTFWAALPGLRHPTPDGNPKLPPFSRAHGAGFCFKKPPLSLFSALPVGS